jgi:hypothetical protein
VYDAHTTRFPDPLISHLVHLYVVDQADGSMRCPDCKRYTHHAAMVGIQGGFCTCPFDEEIL